MKDAAVYAGAAAIGAVAGLRSSMAPGIVRQLAENETGTEHDELGLLTHPITGYAATALAAAEAMAEQMPLMPKRTEGRSLAARAVAGATSGAALCSAAHRKPAIGALLGALGAIAVTYLGTVLRRRASKTPEPLFAIVEDAIAAGAGLLVLSKLRTEAESHA
jgi:uncharacterized membrane protein